MTETQQRFLRSIAERVPVEQVVEVHLFPAIRQGGVETGVAVVAEDPRRPALAGVLESDLAQTVGAEADAHHIDIERSADSALSEVEAGEPLASAEERDGSVESESSDAGDAEIVDAEPQVEGDSDDGADAPAAPPRFIIHTARYRLTLKGVDRGKWEVDVVAEADAPLDAVDAVVRGVQRRSGEGAEPERLTSDAFREALEAPLASLER